MNKLRKKTITIVLTLSVAFSSFAVAPPVQAQAWPDIIGQTFGVTLKEVLETIRRVIEASVKDRAKRAVVRELMKVIIKKSGVITDWQQELFATPQSEGRLYAKNLVGEFIRSGSKEFYQSEDNNPGDSYPQRLRRTALGGLDKEDLDRPTFEDFAGGGAVDPRTGRLNFGRNLSGFVSLTNPDNNFLIRGTVADKADEFAKQRTEAKKLEQTGSNIKTGKDGVAPSVKADMFAKLGTIDVLQLVNAENTEEIVQIMAGVTVGKIMKDFTNSSNQSSENLIKALARKAVNNIDVGSAQKNY